MFDACHEHMQFKQYILYKVGLADMYNMQENLLCRTVH